MKNRLFVAAVAAVLFSISGSATPQPAGAQSSQSKGTPEARRLVAEGDAAGKADPATGKAGDHQKAIDAYRRAIEADPYYVEAHSKYMTARRIGNIDPETNKIDEKKHKAVLAELKALYEGLAAAQPKNPVHQWALGQVSRDRTKDSTANQEKFYRRALEIDPNFAPAYQELALIADFRGDTAREVEYKRRAAELEPDNPDYVFYYAYATKSVDRGLYHTLSLGVADRFPAHERGAQALHWLAFETSDVAAKTALYERLRRDYPPDKFSWSASGMTALADLYLQSDPAKALAVSEAMVQGSGSKTASKDWQDRLSVVRVVIEARELIQKGQPAAAVTRLESAPSLRYADTTVLDQLKAEARDKAGDTAKAYEGLVAIAAKEPTDDINAALTRYAAKLGKSARDVTADVWKVRDAEAKPAPEFTMPDYPDAKPVSLSDYKGKIVLINFWYPTCGPCRGEFPTLQRVLDKYKDRGFVILSPNVLPNEDDLVMPYLRNTGYTFKPLQTNTDWASKNFGARGYPSNHLVDAEGRIVFKPGVIRGERAARTFELQVEALLERAGKNAATSTPQAAGTRGSERKGTPEARKLVAEGDAAQKAGDRAKAIETYRRAIEADPYYVEAHSKYMLARRTGNVDPQTNKLDEAKHKAALAELRAFYERLAAAQPKNPVHQWALGQVSRDLSKDAIANQEKFNRRALEIDPNFAPAYHELALIADFRGDNALDVEYRRKAAELEPDNPDYAFYYASATKRVDGDLHRKLSLGVAERFPAHERGAQALYWLAFETSDVAAKTALYERLAFDYPPEKFSWSASGMTALADLHLASDPAKALALSEAMARGSASKTASTEWQDRLSVVRAVIEGRELIQKGQPAAAATRLESAPALRYADTTVLDLLKAEARDKAGDTAKAYEGLVAIAAKEPTGEINTALARYGAKLRKSPADVTADIWKVRDAEAKPAPAFTMPDYPDSKPVNLSDYKGKVVLINFWYPTCGPCRGEFPTLQRVLDKYKDRGFVILSPNVLPAENDLVMPYLRNTGYTFRPLQSNTDWAKENYGARGYPSNHLVDAEGRIVFNPGVIRGERAARTFELQVEALLERAAKNAPSSSR
jgi:thiol-disulfide isomerase/thioredoxin